MESMSPPVQQSQKWAQTPKIPGLDLLTMEEFDAEMREREMANKAENRNLQPPASKMARNSHLPQSSEPVFLASRPKSEFVSQLNHRAQVHGLTTLFDYEEKMPHLFSASLRLMDKSEEVQSFNTAEALFRTKKEAKDAVAEQGLNYLIAHPPAPKRSSVPQAAAATQVDKSENWMGLLNHYCQISGIPPPIFQDHQQGTAALFSSTCTLHLPPSVANRSVVELGSATTYCSSKKAAKASAAKEAVILLRSKGALPKTTIAAGLHTPDYLASKNNSAAFATTPCSSDTLVSTAMSASSVSPPATSTTSPSPSATTTFSNHPDQPPTSQILNLCSLLGLSPPQYQYTPNPSNPSFYSCAAYFPGKRDRELCGAVGVVERVFGKKQAKAQCAKILVGVLEGVRERRMGMLEELRRGV